MMCLCCFKRNFHRGGFQSRAFVLGFLSRDWLANFRLFLFSFQFVGEHGLHFRPIGFFVRVFYGDDVIVFVVIPGSFVGIGDDEFHRVQTLARADKLKPTVIFIQRVLFDGVICLISATCSTPFIQFENPTCALIENTRTRRLGFALCSRLFSVSSRTLASNLSPDLVSKIVLEYFSNVVKLFSCLSSMDD